MFSMREYQWWCRIGAEYPHLSGKRIGYSSLALVGVAGEVANQVKKMYRDDKGIMTPERREAIKDELGDVFWYLCNACTDLGLTLDEVVQANEDKLIARHGRPLITRYRELHKKERTE